MTRNDASKAPPVAVGATDAVESADRTQGIPGIGTLILGAKYRIDRVLGVGGMGVVMAATHLALDQTVAFKFLRRRLVDTEKDAVDRFLREARAAVNVRSEHVVRVIDVGVLENGTPYLMMEYLTGEDLAAHLASRGPMPVAEAVRFVLEACDAMASAHAKGIVHRDLKPSNLFLTHRSDGSATIKVLDFGISKVMPHAEGQALDLSLTRPGAVMGSPMYMSPEQVRNSRHVDARADIWALGTILHELLSGAPLFDDDTFAALCAAIVADEPVRIRTKRNDVPEEVEAAILRCVEKEPARRFQNVGELAAALLPFGQAPRAGRGSLAQITTGSGLRAVRSMEATLDGDAGADLAASKAPRKTRGMVWAAALVVAAAGVMLFKAQKESGARPAPSPAAPPGASAEQRGDTPLIGSVPSGSGTSSGADHVAAGAPSATPIAPASSVPSKGALKRRLAVNAPAAGSAALVAPGTAPAAPAARSEEDLLMNRH